MDKKLNVLILSSSGINQHAGLAADLKKALELNGHNVDFFTNDNITKPKISRLKQFIRKSIILSRIVSVIREAQRIGIDKYVSFTHWDERTVPIDPKIITDSINKSYDLVITCFLHFMVSAKTLEEIYNKLHCPILIYAVDMYPFTAGCNFFSKCRNMAIECKDCHGVKGQKKKAMIHNNYLIKKDIYSRINCALLCNTWMSRFAKMSGLFPDERIVKQCICIDENHFFRSDIEEVRKRLSIPESKSIILSFRQSDSPRKGVHLLAKALDKVYDEMSENEREKVLVLPIGKRVSKEHFDIKFDYRDLGVIDSERLIDVYAASTIFLSPSIDDPGPSMVNQALMCGTPVVAFSIGTALDVIDGKGTGYMAKNFDTADYAVGIQQILSKSDVEYQELRNRCREIALQTSALSNYTRLFEDCYEKFKE